MKMYPSCIVRQVLWCMGEHPLAVCGLWHHSMYAYSLNFCIAGIVDTPVGSLFTYQPGETWATFYDPFFQPTYEPKFATPELEAEAKELCGDDIFCLFDVAATGSMEIGLSTLRGGEEIEEITEVQIPGL